MKMKLFFVVPVAGRIFGSTYLRGFQLCDIAKKYLGDRYDCQIFQMPVRNDGISKLTLPARQWLWAATCPKDAVYFVTKQCIERLDPVAASIFHARVRALLFDYVDINMEEIGFRDADIHICASQRQLRYVDASLPQYHSGTALLLHHGFDARLSGVQGSAGNQLRAVYCGAATNAYIPDGIKGRIEFLDGSTPDLMGAALRKLSLYNFHYCIRPSSEEKEIIFKPLTKVANAAACGANVIVNRNSDDVLEELGEDYPYLVESVDDDEITETISRAEIGVGGREWNTGLKIMNELRIKFSPKEIAMELGQIVDLVVH